MTVAPFVYVIGPYTSRLADGFDESTGPRYREQVGAHGIWAARVPFIPAMDGAELVQGGNRIGKIVGRHFRFLYDLARAHENQATFELRFIAYPSRHTSDANRIQIAFLGKVFHPQRSKIESIAQELWRKFLSNFPLEDPFNYPIEPVTNEVEFGRIYQPISSDLLTFEYPACISEIRRYEEMPIEIVGRPLAAPKEYIVHPFVPTLDYSAMGRLLETLAVQTTCCFAGISIRPVALDDIEIHNFSEMAGRLRRMAESDAKSDRSDTIEYGTYRSARAEMGARIYESLMRESEFLMQIKVQVVGLPTAPNELVEALGSEMMNNGHNQFPTKWVQMWAQNQAEFAVAKNNLFCLEHDEWGQSLAPPKLARLRSIANVYQAAGAFRLPIPPESGYMPGILVKSEPFVTPQEFLDDKLNGEYSENLVQIGEIYHRGSPTGQQMVFPTSSLIRHGLIAGSTGSGKSTTILSILSELRSQTPPVPFLVLYPLDKPDYRELLRCEAIQDKLLIFTVGDETVAPFRFNPFAVPDGVLLKTHLSRLMRAFGAAFDLFPPLPMIYRQALRNIYEQKGWDVLKDHGRRDGDYPTLADFYEAIKEVTGGLKYSSEIKDTVQEASVIRISDLLDNAGNVLNVKESPPFTLLLDHPVVMELGRIGSQEDINLVMAFLLVMLIGSLGKRDLSTQHVTVVEEAHRLMERRVQHGEGGYSGTADDFANMLAEVRGYNAGLLIAEQIPSQLVHSAIGNTYLKIMHWLEERESFDLFADIMNLTEQQRAYARRLKPGEAIVRSQHGRPVHIRVEPLAASSASSNPIDDKWLATEMPVRLRRLGLSMAEPPVGVRRSLDSEQVERRTVEQMAKLIFYAPLRVHCAFCKPLQQTMMCPHRASVVGLYKREDGQALAREMYMVIKQRQPTRLELRAMSRRLAELGHFKDEIGIGYCFLAHLNEQIFSGDFTAQEQRNAGLCLADYPWEEREGF